MRKSKKISNDQELIQSDPISHITCICHMRTTKPLFSLCILVTYPEVKFSHGMAHFSQVLVFDDAPNGVEAVHADGMPCVWVPHKEQDRSVLNGKRN